MDGVRSLARGCTQAPPGCSLPSPRLSGVLGTAGMVPIHRNRHSRRIASAANSSSAVQMMIKCYCARENGKEDSLALLSGRTPWAPAPSSKAGLTPCVLRDTKHRRGIAGNEDPGTETAALSPQEPARMQRAPWRASSSPRGCCSLAPYLLDL